MATDIRPLEAWGWLHQVHALLWNELSRQMEAEVSVSLLEHGCGYELSVAPAGHLRMNDLAELLGISPSGVTRLVDRLVERGWVRRESPAGNRRTTYAMLTGQGQTAYSRNNKVFARIVGGLIGSRLTDRDLADIRRVLGKLRG